MATSLVPQTIDAEGSSLEDARDAVRSQLPEGLAILSIEVVFRAQGLTAVATAATVKAFDEVSAKQDDLACCIDDFDDVHVRENIDIELRLLEERLVNGQRQSLSKPADTPAGDTDGILALIGL